MKGRSARRANPLAASVKNSVTHKTPSASNPSLLNRRAKNSNAQEVLIESNWQLMQNESHSRGEFTVAGNDLSESLKISPMLPRSKRASNAANNRPSAKSQVSDYNKFSFCPEKR